jgi:hypothetical protein
VDEAAVRNTADVDLLVRREDFPAFRVALEEAGFTYHETLGVAMFLDGAQASARDAIHVLFANEKVQDDYAAPTPDVAESEHLGRYRVIRLEPLVRMKLTSYHRKDQTHIDDMIDLGLIDTAWLDRLPDELAERLKYLLDTPGQ